MEFEGLQVLQEQPHWGEEPLEADLCHWEHSERKVTEPHRSRAGWDDIPCFPFCKNFEGKWEGNQWRIQKEGFGSGCRY